MAREKAKVGVASIEIRWTLHVRRLARNCAVEFEFPDLATKTRKAATDSAPDADPAFAALLWHIVTVEIRGRQEDPEAAQSHS